MARFVLLRPGWRGLWLGLAGAAVAWLLAPTAPCRGLDDWLLDGCFCLRGPRPTETRIVLVGIDDDYLNGLGKPVAYLSPELAAVVTHLKRQGAAAIGIHLLIPDTATARPEIERAGGRGDARPMGKAILEAGNVVLSEEQKPRGGWLRPLMQWRTQDDLAFRDVTPDWDGVVRRQQLLARDTDKAVPQFALALLACGRDVDIKWKPDPEALRLERLGGETIRLDEEQRLRINFVGPPGTWPQRRFADVLAAARQNREQPEFAGAIAIIGITGSLGDYWRTPYANPVFGRLYPGGPGDMTGMELNANVIATLADRAYLTTAGRPVLLALLLASGALLGLGCGRLPAWGAAAAAALCAAAWMAGSYLAFARGNTQPPLAPALLLFLLVVPVAVLRRRGRAAGPAGRGGAGAPAPSPTPAPGQPAEELEAGMAALRPDASDDRAVSSQSVLVRYPVPVAVAYRRCLRQQEPRVRLDMLFFAVEALQRYLVTLGVCDLLRGLAESGQPNAQLPPHPAFDCLRRPRPMQLGMWAELLRETARALAADQRRVVRELPEVCRPGGRLDRDLLGPLIRRRNDFCHPDGSIALTPGECAAVVREARPLLEQALQEAHFVCRYPLGFARPGVGPATGAGLRRYALHSCMGAQVADPASAYALEAALPLEEGVPFVAAPDGTRLLYLWPLLLQRVSPLTGRHTLYAFEQVADGRHPFLGAVRLASVEAREEWALTLWEGPAADHAWLLRRLRELPAAPAVPPALRLPARLLPRRAGRLVGQILGGNRLLAVIASGGFGTVYAAEAATGERVAVKVIEGPTTPDQVKRFLREFAKLQAAGRHPGVVRCLASGVSVLGGTEYPWYSMEFAAGGDLAGRLEERRAAAGGAAPWDEPGLRGQVAAEFRAVAGAVAHLHGLGIVHRDLKPGNVLITADGDLRLSDFGLVKSLEPSEASLGGGPVTSTGAVLGTRRYMAPEQARGAAVGAAADVYALGVLLAELATGDRPEPDGDVAAGSTLSAGAAIRRLPAPIRAFLLRCTDRDPTRRPPDAKSALAEFEALAAGPQPAAANRGGEAGS